MHHYRTYAERDIFGNYYRHYLLACSHHRCLKCRILYTKCNIIPGSVWMSREIESFPGLSLFGQYAQRCSSETSATAKCHFKFTVRLNCFHCQATWIIITINTISSCALMAYESEQMRQPMGRILECGQSASTALLSFTFIKQKWKFSRRALSCVRLVLYEGVSSDTRCWCRTLKWHSCYGYRHSRERKQIKKGKSTWNFVGGFFK